MATNVQSIYLAEVDAFAAGTAGAFKLGYGQRVYGKPRGKVGPLESTLTIRASDRGFVTQPADPMGQVVYQPFLETAFEIDRRVNLDPGNYAVGFGYGQLTLKNFRRHYDSIELKHNVDGRAVRVLRGDRTYEDYRGIFVDPAYSALKEVFVGICQPWHIDRQNLNIPLRDAAYWLERPLQTQTYQGTGTYEGSPELKGRKKPKARGGNNVTPIRNVTPILIDPVKLIYQYNDGPGEVINLYEGGFNGTGGITRQSNVSDLYVGTTNAGQFRTDNNRGLFQLGSPPSRLITCDIIGKFPVAGQNTRVTNTVRYLLLEDMQLPAELLDLTSINVLNTTDTPNGGYYFDGSTEVDGLTAVSLYLSSIGAKLVPTRTGKLSVKLLRPIPANKASVAVFDSSVITSIEVDDLPNTLNPPPYRFRMGHSKNFTVQNSDLNPQVTEARKQILKEPFQYGTYFNSQLAQAYRRPNDYAPFESVLLSDTEAQTIANVVGGLWASSPRVYAITVPLRVALARDLFDVVTLKYPLGNLDSGRQGQIVGEQIRSSASTATLQVLV